MLSSNSMDQTNKKIDIIRADGTVDTFRPNKLSHSLRRAGASRSAATAITEEIASTLKPGDSTHKIYQKAFALLKKNDRPTASRFSIRTSIAELGPSGYPFEQLIGRLFATEGYQVSFPEITRGRCIGHEVDVVAQRGEEKIMIEAKFHNQANERNNIKTALYVEARFLDVKANQQNKFTTGWLVTNTKFTTDAIRYSECVGLKLLGWSYPKNDGLEDKLNRSGLQPITILLSLSKSDKRLLLDNDIVVCSDIIKHPDKLKQIGLPNGKINRLLTEVKAICNS